MSRLSALGFATYAEYLASERWHLLREKVGRRARWRCTCGARATEVHHRSYDRLGREPLADLRAVCRDCHAKIHHHVEQGMDLAAATDAVIQAPEPAVAPRKPTPRHSAAERALPGAVEIPPPDRKKRHSKKPILTDEQRANNDRIRGWRKKKKRRKKSKKGPKYRG